MNVAIVTLDVFETDGQARVNFELARHLLGRGIGVDLIADRVDDRLLDDGAHWVHAHPVSAGTHLVRSWHFRHLANRAVAARRRRYDVILACGAVLDEPHTVNVAHFVHHTWQASPFHPSRTGRGLRRPYHRLYTGLNARWERRSFRQAEVVVGVSETVRDAVVAAGIDRSATTVIPNGVDATTYAPGEGDRAAFGLPDGVPLALFAGDLQSPIKNLDTVLGALSSLPDVHLAVAGSTDGSPYPALAGRMGLSDRVHFLGYCREMPALMRTCDLLVFPSHQDSFGLVLAEAMASGLPVVTARTVGASVLVTPETGFVLDRPTDTESLTAAMSALAGNPERRRRMGRAARRAVEAHTWERMAERYLALFEDLAGSAPSPAEHAPAPPERPRRPEPARG